MQTKHTPSPWIDNGEGHIVHRSGDIARVVSDNKADARLLAAAPDLLAALKQLLDAAGYGWSIANGIGKDEWQRRSAIVGQAEAAITKATGE